MCDIDEVIRLIRESQTRDEAIQKLMDRGFRIPADHPYAPQIPQRLLNATAEGRRPADTGAGRGDRAVAAHPARRAGDREAGRRTTPRLIGEIEEYEDILATPRRVMQIILDEIADLKKRYADARRTVIEEGEAEGLDIAALTPVEQSW